MRKQMWFGTDEYQTWIRCPLIDAGMSLSGYSESGNFLNGGGFARRSITGARTHTYSWNTLSREELSKITAFLDGAYGPGPYYFVDPSAARGNMLPTYLSAPRLGVQGAPSFGGEPTLAATPANTNGYPTQSAFWETIPPSAKKFRFPVPDGYSFHFGAHGERTGTAAVGLVPSGGITYRWSGTPNNSPSEEVSSDGVTVLRTNWIHDPRFQENSTWTIGTGSSWGGSPRVLSLGDSLGVGGNIAYQQAYTSNWVTPGETVSSAVRLQVPSSAPTIQARSAIIFMDSSGNTVTPVIYGTTQLVVTGGAPVTLSQSLIAPAGAQSARLYIYLMSAAASGRQVQLSQAMLVRGATTGGYFDGDTTNGSTIPIVPVSESDTARVNTTVTDVDFVDVILTGTGALRLSGLIAQVLPDGQVPEPGGYIQGMGQSGMKLADLPEITENSAVNDRHSLALSLIETGAWA